MTIEEMVWDILEIKGALEDDSDLEELWVLQKVNQYRAIHIEMEFNLTNEINPIWLQRIHSFNFEKVTSADDPAITVGSIEFGKAVLPRVIKLSDDFGTYRLSGSGGVSQLEPCDFNRLVMNAELKDFHGQYGYYSKVGDIVYVSPYIMTGAAIVIVENPFDIKVNENGVLRDMTVSDNYPLDATLAQRVILDVLTKDLALAANAITDIVNDSQDKFKIMKDAKA